MRMIETALLAAVAFFATMVVANALARVHIDLTTQRMHVQSSHDDYTWRVSTARSGYHTPRGSFAPIQDCIIHADIHMEPMPYAIFFKSGYAIHGSLQRL